VTNGGLPASDLCTLWDGKHTLRADAAVALAKLNLGYRKRFGRDICISDGYRTLAEQRAVKSARGGFAATPGTSNHGWGLAVDLCDGVQNDTSVTYWWLRDNAPAYGFDNPGWALRGGSGPYEPWHWEYVPGVTERSTTNG
jgi:LAS superfamily LD-carboxypeptidase LdcB